MAAVNFFDSFLYKWAQSGAVVTIQDDQYKLGWSFIGSTPPSVEQFNAWGQFSDEKHSWLFSQIQAAATAKGIALTATDPDGLLKTIDSVAAGRLLNIKVFASPGTFTYTKTPGTKSVVVEVQGGGAAGGGVPATTATTASSAGGGGAGGYAKSRLLSDFDGLTIVVGAGGIGVANADGGNGGASSFGALLSAPGGGGGTKSTAYSAFPAFNGYGIGGGVGIGGNITNSGGGHGGTAFMPNLVTFISGSGGASYFGGGASAIINTPSPGGAAMSPGSGGSGAGIEKSGTAQAGGNGATGIVIVWEYA